MTILMTTKAKIPAYKKQIPTKLTSEEIEQDTEAFIKSGGNIQYIKSGVSGQNNVAGPRHIVLSKKR